MNANNSRQRIRKHLRHRGSELIYTTPRMILVWWNQLNHAVFGSMLPRPHDVKLVKHKQAYAYSAPCGFRQICLTMHPRFISRKLFLAVLVHEMVHAWEILHHNRMGHGKRFFRWKRKIKWAIGLDLTEKYHDHT